ncbi:hypothetical protein Aperf_G00000130687 [Anoplocephala perfoliata]
MTKRSGDKLLHFYEELLETPWIKGVDHQYELPIERKTFDNFPDPGPQHPFVPVELPNDDEYAFVYRRHAKKLRKKLNFNDPDARYLWQFLNVGDRFFGKYPGIDINVYPVYSANITGRNVLGIIVDDALDTTHEDLRPNIKFEFLADLVNNTRWDARGTDAEMSNSNEHGTEVGGLFAAVANNSRCAFGVAYDAKMGAVRLLGDKVTDYMVGEAFSLFAEDASVYISSWGPMDDGKAMLSPGKYANKALKNAWLNGNHGRGALVVFPTGNGGIAGDNCGADGFINHPNVISVGAVSEHGLPPFYAESCSAVAVAVPVGGAEDKITFLHQLTTRHLFVPTTQVNNMCTKSFFGTSASNPMVAGVIALAMEANSDITARDVSAILALSGRIPTASASDISVNGGGLLVSHEFGSGLLNAVRMVKLARNWWDLVESKIPMKHRTSETCTLTEQRGSPLHSTLPTVFSPSGQVGHLLRPRIKDYFSGDTEMIWKSLMHTGERCYGKWVVTVRDTGRRKYPLRAKRGKVSGMIRFIGLELLGTSKNESAFEQNKQQIVKQWHPARLFAHDTNRAFKLNQEDIAELYDHDRWHAAFETMDN